MKENGKSITQDKYLAAIIEYEESRISVNVLNEKRCVEISKCTANGDVEKEICLVSALKEVKELNFDCGYGYPDGYSYDEVLHTDGCEHCIESYRIKTGELAEQRQRFGIAKRRLSAMGKALIKKVCEEELVR